VVWSLYSFLFPAFVVIVLRMKLNVGFGRVVVRYFG
jgi:hypothetical protein